MCTEGGLRTWEHVNQKLTNRKNRGISTKNRTGPAEAPTSNVQLRPRGTGARDALDTEPSGAHHIDCRCIDNRYVSGKTTRRRSPRRGVHHDHRQNHDRLRHRDRRRAARGRWPTTGTAPVAAAMANLVMAGAVDRLARDRLRQPGDHVGPRGPAVADDLLPAAQCSGGPRTRSGPARPVLRPSVCPPARASRRRRAGGRSRARCRGLHLLADLRAPHRPVAHRAAVHGGADLAPDLPHRSLRDPAHPPAGGPPAGPG